MISRLNKEESLIAVWNSYLALFSHCGCGLVPKCLEVGARYGHASCQLAKVLGLNGTHGDAQGAKQVSVDADPLVWDILEKNLADHECDVQVVRGTIGSKSYKLCLRKRIAVQRAKSNTVLLWRT